METRAELPFTGDQVGLFRGQCPQGHASIPFAPTRQDLPLPKPFRGAILPSKPLGIWRMSAHADEDALKALSKQNSGGKMRTVPILNSIIVFGLLTLGIGDLRGEEDPTRPIRDWPMS